MNAKSLIILAIVTLLVVIVAIVVVTQKQPLTPLSTEQLVFPELLKKVDTVTEVNVATKEDNFTIVKGEKQWGLREKQQYPVAIDKISQLILGLAELKIVEAKTANPALYSKLGVEEITVEGAQSVQFTLKEATGHVLASLIVGENQVSKTDATQREFYLRKTDDPQTWLAIGTLPVDKTPTQWLDKQVLDIDNARIQRVQVTHPDGEVVTIFREVKENEDYQLADLSEHKQIKSMYALKQMASTLTDLNMNDVTVASEIAFTPEASTQAVFDTFDGLKITMTLTEHADKHFAQISVKGVKSEDKPSEAVQTEANNLQEKLATWAFEIPLYKATALLKRQAELVEAKPAGADEMGNVTTQEFLLPPLEEALGHPITP